MSEEYWIAFFQLCHQTLWPGDVTAARSCVVLPFQMPSTHRNQFVWCQTLAVVLPETQAVCLKSGVLLLAAIRGELALRGWEALLCWDLLGAATVPPLEGSQLHWERGEVALPGALFAHSCRAGWSNCRSAGLSVLAALHDTTHSGFLLQPCASEAPSWAVAGCCSQAVLVTELTTEGSQHLGVIPWPTGRAYTWHPHPAA